MKKLIFISAVVLAFGVVGAYAYFASRLPVGIASLEIKGKTFQVEVADNFASRAQGLSFRESIEEDRGMLFVFPEAGMHGFWMKDMDFPIDIIWIQDDVIVGFSENAIPEPEKSLIDLQLYYPPRDVQKVLEVKAGVVKKFGFQVGDKVSFRF